MLQQSLHQIDEMKKWKVKSLSVRFPTISKSISALCAFGWGSSTLLTPDIAWEWQCPCDQLPCVSISYQCWGQDPSACGQVRCVQRSDSKSIKPHKISYQCSINGPRYMVFGICWWVLPVGTNSVWLGKQHFFFISDGLLIPHHMICNKICTHWKKMCN